TFETAIATTAADNGRLMKKMDRQEVWSINHPPSSGPAAAVIDVNPDHVPMAWPRRFESNEALRMARLPGTSSAAAAPCAARNNVNCRTSPANPHAAEKHAKRRDPRANIFLLPKWSPRDPPISRRAAKESADRKSTRL